MRPLIVLIVGDGGVGVIAGRGVVVGFWLPYMLVRVVAVACDPRARIALSCSVVGLTNLPFIVFGRAGYAGKSAGWGPLQLA